TALPDLVGQSERQAGMTLTRDSFQLGRVVRVRQAGLAEPQVVAQSPQAGTKLLRGDVVDLVVAEPAGRPKYMMPDLRGVTLERARQAIEKAGLVLGHVEIDRNGGPEGTVLEQRPRAGVRVSKGDRVDLLAASR
ncbi:MAG: PASTA domain-containing protein, partial [Gammaproteobacteria bacterium]|nr:PASTA domain-containing protein [Gammaproteobacteria bacterium]